MTDQPLDRIDFEILSLLSKNARSSNKEIAAATGLAASTCHERLKRLKKTGVLAGTHVDVNLKAIGFSAWRRFFLSSSPVNREKRWSAS